MTLLITRYNWSPVPDLKLLDHNYFQLNFYGTCEALSGGINPLQLSPGGSNEGGVCRWAKEKDQEVDDINTNKAGAAFDDADSDNMMIMAKEII